MRLTNGCNRVVQWNAAKIKAEASQDGDTSIVTAVCDNGDEVSISQHGSGDWDISVNDEEVDSFNSNEGDAAVACFMRHCQTRNS